MATKKEYLDNLAAQLIPKKDVGWSGEVNLRHTSGNPRLRSFTDPKNIPERIRYDGTGGVLGGEGVYLDSNGHWTNPGATDLWEARNTYDVSGRFENAKIITPSNIKEYVKDIDTTNKQKYFNEMNAYHEMMLEHDGYGMPYDVRPEPYITAKKPPAGTISKDLISGAEVVSKAKAEGRDALILKGFDDSYDAAVKNAYDRHGVSEEVRKMPWAEQQELWKTDPYQDIKLENAQKEYIDFGEKLKEIGVDPNIAQDQVVSLKPKELNVVGKSDMTKPYEFTNFKAPSQPVGPALLELAMLEGISRAGAINPLNEGEDELMMRINALNKQKYLDSLKK